MGFILLDKDEDGSLCIAECRQMLTALKTEMSGPELGELFRAVDKEERGVIDFLGFLRFVKAVEDPSSDWAAAAPPAAPSPLDGGHKKTKAKTRLSVQQLEKAVFKEIDKDKGN